VIMVRDERVLFTKMVVSVAFADYFFRSISLSDDITW